MEVKPFKFLAFLEFECTREVNNHIQAYVKGCISEEEYDAKVTTFKENQEIEIIIYDNSGASQTFLKGQAIFLSTFIENNARILELSLISYSKKADTEPHIRTFQKDSLTYDDVKSNLESNDAQGLSIIIPEDSTKAIDSMLVQYNETDWEFCKRIASRLNTVLIPDSLNSYPMFSLGPISTSKTVSISANKLVERTDLEELAVHTGVEGYTPLSCKYYTYETRDFYNLCDNLVVNSSSLYVWRVHSQLLGGELIHEYTLKFREGFKVKEFHNKELIGTELTGSISKVENEKVQVRVQADTGAIAPCWFDYATVYSSPGDIGWYFMPEEGDTVRLCFPTEKEKDAYVASAVHLGSRDNHDTKSIRTAHSKEIVFAPGFIAISCPGSEIYLDDEQGIRLDSQYSINISAKEDMTIETEGKIVVSAEERIQINQNEGQIDIKKGIVDISGRHVRTR